jgi:hypothetical protein
MNACSGHVLSAIKSHRSVSDKIFRPLDAIRFQAQGNCTYTAARNDDRSGSQLTHLIVTSQSHFDHGNTHIIIKPQFVGYPIPHSGLQT